MSARLPALVVACAALSGCELLFMNRDMADRPPDDDDILTPAERDLNGDGDLFEEEGLDAEAPSLDGIDLPTLRPLGARDALVLTVSDDTGLVDVTASFGPWTSATVPASGTSDVVAIDASSLTEGMGTLAVAVRDEDGLVSTFFFDDVVIDLSPPVVEIGPTVIGRGVDGDGELSLWMGDAWVLGSVEVRFGGATLTHALPAGWPSTLGEEWDWTYVTFPGASLPEGAGPATVRAIDAAGNLFEETIQLVVDGTAPTVTLAPVADAPPGTVVVDVAAADDALGPVWIDLRARGLLVASAVGPSARVALPASDFASGPLELVAVARDQAGNEARSAPVVVDLAP